MYCSKKQRHGVLIWFVYQRSPQAWRCTVAEKRSQTSSATNNMAEPTAPKSQSFPPQLPSSSSTSLPTVGPPDVPPPYEPASNPLQSELKHVMWMNPALGKAQFCVLPPDYELWAMNFISLATKTTEH